MATGQPNVQMEAEMRAVDEREIRARVICMEDVVDGNRDQIKQRIRRAEGQDWLSPGWILEEAAYE